MLKKYFPYAHVKNVFEIDYKKLYKKGYRAIMFDLDNTLVHHGDNSNEKVDNLFKTLKKIGFKTLILSNNDEERVKRFLKNIDSLYICDAEKPNSKNYLKAIEMLKEKKENVIYIGDQIFIDIVGANNVGLPNILVDFIKLDSEKKIGKKRYIEKIILKIYNLTKYKNRIECNGDEENE